MQLMKSGGMKEKENRELKSLLEKLKEKTGIEFSIANQNSAGTEETLKQLRLLLAPGKPYIGKSDFLRQIFTGEPAAANSFDSLKWFRMNPEEIYYVCMIQLCREGTAEAETVLKNLFSSPASDCIVRMDDLHFVLVMNAKGIPAGENNADTFLADTARNIVDTLSAEVMVKVCVSYTITPRKALNLLESYREAALAMKIGTVFSENESIFSYNRLGIARLIYELPEDVCNKYLHEVYGNGSPVKIDEETTNLINTFFNSNLNISEAARRLYMHRNTLVYRLEKLAESTGLDIRNFKEALTYKITDMIQKYLKYRKKSL